MNDSLNFRIRTSSSRTPHSFRFLPTADQSWNAVSPLIRTRLGLSADERLELEYQLGDESDRQAVTGFREWSEAKEAIKTHKKNRSEGGLVFDLVEVEAEHMSWEIRTVDRFKELDDDEDARSTRSGRSDASRKSRSSRHGSRKPSRKNVETDPEPAEADDEKESTTKPNPEDPIKDINGQLMVPEVTPEPQARPALKKVDTSTFLPGAVPLVASPAFTHHAGPPSVRSASPPLNFQAMDLGNGFDDRLPKSRPAKKEHRHDRDRDRDRERERDRHGGDRREYERGADAEHRRRGPEDYSQRDREERSPHHRSHQQRLRDDEGSFRPPFSRNNSPRAPPSRQTQSPRLPFPELLRQIEDALVVDKSMFYTIKGVLADWQERRIERKQARSAAGSSATAKGPGSVVSNGTAKTSSRLRGAAAHHHEELRGMAKHADHHQTDVSATEAPPREERYRDRERQSRSRATSPEEALRRNSPMNCRSNVPTQQQTLRPAGGVTSPGLHHRAASPDRSHPPRPVTQNYHSAPHVLQQTQRRFYSNGAGIAAQPKPKNDDARRQRKTWDVDTDMDDTDNDTPAFMSQSFTRNRKPSPPPAKYPQAQRRGPSAPRVANGFVRPMGPGAGRFGTAFGGYDFDDFPQ